MGSSTKEHRAPIRYSLKPHEARRVASIIHAQGGATDKQVKGLARRLNCAAKTIHDIVSRHGFDVTPHNDNAPRPRRDRDRLAEAEKHLAAQQEKCQASAAPDGGEAGADDDQASSAERNGVSLDALDSALDILAQEERRLNRERMAGEEDLAARTLELEAQLAREKAALEEERQKVREALHQTAALRRRTRDERTELETLRGRVGQAERKQRNAEARAKEYREIALEDRQHLKDSMARERSLVEALRRAERDLADRTRELKRERSGRH